MKFFFMIAKFCDKTVFFNIEKKILFMIMGAHLLTLFHVGGKETSPTISFFGITFFAKNRIKLKILDFLSYTFSHPIQLQISKLFIIAV